MSPHKYCYDYPRPAVGADCVIIDRARKEILLIERKNEPYKAMWALPGGFVEENETVEAAAIRELEEEARLTGISLHLLGVFSDPGRDPRGRIITLAYVAFVEKHDLNPVAGDDAKNVKWFSIDNLPQIAFDHSEIIRQAMEMPVRMSSDH